MQSVIYYRRSVVAPKSIYCEYFKIHSSILILCNNYTMPPRITSRAFSALTIAQSSAGSSSTPPPAAFSLSQRKRSPSLHSSTPRHFSTLLVLPGNPPNAPGGWKVSRRVFVISQYLTDDVEIISFFHSSPRFCKRPIRCPWREQRCLLL